jgi:hypothetical protein
MLPGSCGTWFPPCPPVLGGRDLCAKNALLEALADLHTAKAAPLQGPGSERTPAAATPPGHHCGRDMVAASGRFRWLPTHDWPAPERRSSLSSRVRNPDAGWDAETARAAVEEAAKRLNDPDLPAFVRDCLIILQHLMAYLDSLHGSAGFREALTPTERRQVGQLVSDLLDRKTEG